MALWSDHGPRQKPVSTTAHVLQAVESARRTAVAKRSLAGPLLMPTECDRSVSIRTAEPHVWIVARLSENPAWGETVAASGEN